MLLWLFYVASINEIYWGVHVRWPILSSDFNQTWNLSTDFSWKTLMLRFHANPSSASRAYTCVQTDMTKLSVAKSDYAHAHEMSWWLVITLILSEGIKRSYNSNERNVRFVETEYNNPHLIVPCVVTGLSLRLNYGVICGEHLKISVGNVPTRRYTLPVKMSEFTGWRHTWRKNWVYCAFSTGNSAGLRTVLSSRLSHRELRSSLRESHSFLSLPADAPMASSQGTPVSSNSFSR